MLSQLSLLCKLMCKLLCCLLVVLVGAVVLVNWLLGFQRLGPGLGREL